MAMPALTEFEDRLVAMAEGEWIDLATGKDVLEGWFEKSLTRSEFTGTVDRLIAAGLLDCELGNEPIWNTSRSICDLAELHICTTQSGDEYLAMGRE
jgi:hypothetical protein